MLSDFATAMHAQAAPIIGHDTLVIGSDSILCVPAESMNSSEFIEGGFAPERGLTVVCKTSSMPSASILKKTGAIGGVTYRVQTVSKGATFTTIGLQQVEKA